MQSGDLTLFDSRRIHRARLLDSTQVTDSYLLALAATWWAAGHH
jgi:hypothetical protein